MEMLFCGSPTLVINVLVNIFGWRMVPGQWVKFQPFHNSSVVLNSLVFFENILNRFPCSLNA